MPEPTYEELLVLVVLLTLLPSALLLVRLLVLVLVPMLLSVMALPSPQKVPPRHVGSCRCCFYRRCAFSPRG